MTTLRPPLTSCLRGLAVASCKSVLDKNISVCPQTNTRAVSKLASQFGGCEIPSWLEPKGFFAALLLNSKSKIIYTCR